MEEPLMKFPDGEPCATCAIRPGTLASRTLETVALFRECVETGEPFFCHESCERGFIPEEMAIGYVNPKRLCRGWVAAINRKGKEPQI